MGPHSVTPRGRIRGRGRRRRTRTKRLVSARRFFYGLPRARRLTQRVRDYNLLAPKASGVNASRLKTPNAERQTPTRPIHLGKSGFIHLRYATARRVRGWYFLRVDSRPFAVGLEFVDFWPGRGTYCGLRQILEHDVLQHFVSWGRRSPG